MQLFTVLILSTPNLTSLDLRSTCISSSEPPNRDRKRHAHRHFVLSPSHVEKKKMAMCTQFTRFVRSDNGIQSTRTWGVKRRDRVGIQLSGLEHRTVTPLTQVRFPGAAKDFSPRVNFQCRLSYVCPYTLCAITCINICVHVKDPVVPVTVRWISDQKNRVRKRRVVGRIDGLKYS